jgi:predicted metal-binding transcription factor (methanogenesis marker protein 9)
MADSRSRLRCCSVVGPDERLAFCCPAIQLAQAFRDLSVARVGLDQLRRSKPHLFAGPFRSGQPAVTGYSTILA